MFIDSYDYTDVHMLDKILLVGLHLGLFTQNLWPRAPMRLYFAFMMNISES